MIACLFLFAAPALAQDLIYHFEDSGPGTTGCPRALAGPGDVDGDGLDDMLVSVPYKDPTSGLSVGAVRVISGATGQLLLEVTGGPQSMDFGTRVSGLGDANGDGFNDLLVGDQYWGAPGTFPPYFEGRVFVHSGLDGATLLEVPAPVPQTGFGQALKGVGDVNADGVPDFIAGSPFEGGPFLQPEGVARVISAADGATLAAHHGGQDLDWVGFSFAGVGDVDGDGSSDYAIADPKDDSAGPSQGKLVLYSGASASILWTATGNQPQESFANSVDGAGDVNGDGVVDLVVGASMFALSPQGPGELRVLSGVDGSLLFSVQGKHGEENLGGAIGLGDADGDGLGDVAGNGHDFVTVPGQLFCPDWILDKGFVRAWSPASGAELFSLVGAAPNDSFGAVDALGDVNGDSVPDLLIAAPQYTQFGLYYCEYPGGPGYWEVTSTGPLALASKTHELSISAGGTQRFTLDGGAPLAGSVYIVLGSSSGVLPGIPLGTQWLPLNPDTWFTYTLTQPFDPHFVKFLHSLDAGGLAFPKLKIPAGAPGSLVGLTLVHAAVVLGSGGIELVTNAVPVTLGG